MTESDARNVLFIRAFESAPSHAWSADDAAWASAEARRLEGERAPFEKFLARRAELAIARLARRDATARLASAALGPHAWLGWLGVALAFALGVASDAIGPSGRINILAPPLLAALVWNLAVYVILLLRFLGALRLDPNPGPLRRWFLRTSARVARAIGGEALADSARGRFVTDWMGASGALQGARVALVLHAGAAAFVVGALLSLYVRGIAFEYRAGWDSTFLTPGAVHRVLQTVLGPAADLSGLALPDVDRLAQLRFSVGTGENAARWIHLYALTLGLAIVVPRLLLATIARWRAGSLIRRFPLALDDDYFTRLRRAFSGEVIEALVLPYSYRVAPEAKKPLTLAVQDVVGPPISLSLVEPLPQGAEDDLQPWLKAGAKRLIVALFAATATPERETHGAFVRALAVHPAVSKLIVLIDEAEFRRRFTGADGARRLAERRAAWQRMLDDEGEEPVFVDLAATP
jgi:hypothetical protein